MYHCTSYSPHWGLAIKLWNTTLFMPAITLVTSLFIMAKTASHLDYQADTLQVGWFMTDRERESWLHHMKHNLKKYELNRITIETAVFVFVIAYSNN